jgi:hypothetical protein
MILNLALSGGLGLLPGLGSVLLTSFRPNVRNAALLEEYLRMRSRNRPKVAAQSGAPAEKKTDPDDEKAATDDKKDTADEKKVSTDEKKAAPEDEGRIELSDEGQVIESVTGTATATALLADAGIPTLNVNDNQGAKADAGAGTTPAGGGTGTPGAGGNGQAPDASAGALAPARQDGNNDTNKQGASASVVVPGSNNNDDDSGGQGGSGSGSGSGFTRDLGEETILEITASESLRSGERVMEEALNVAIGGDTSGPSQAVGSALLRVAALHAPDSLQRHSRFIEDITDSPDAVDIPRDMPGDWEEGEVDIP